MRICGIGPPDAIDEDGPTDLEDDFGMSDSGIEGKVAIVTRPGGGMDLPVGHAAISGMRQSLPPLGADWDDQGPIMDGSVNEELLRTRACSVSMSQRSGRAIVDHSTTVACMGVGDREKERKRERRDRT